MTVVYHIMHGELCVAHIATNGSCKIYNRAFMPYDLYLEESDDFDDRINNLSNFYYWCASRVLTLDRQFAKVIMNSLGVEQAITDKDRAEIALSYNCLTITDIYWVKRDGEDISFSDINLYEQHMGKYFTGVFLKGRQMTITNSHLVAGDMSTNGCFPKAWVRDERGFVLFKDGGAEYVYNEVLASKICQCFDCNQVVYRLSEFDGQPVTESTIMTSPDYSIVSRKAFEIYAANADIDPLIYIIELDSHGYYMMNILDYLIGNTDRHWGNWGLLVDNKTNKPLRLHDLMDFNQAFNCYDTLEGANSLTEPGKSQQQSAIDAVHAIGLNQVCTVNPKWFNGDEGRYTMFCRRLQSLTQ